MPDVLELLEGHADGLHGRDEAHALRRCEERRVPVEDGPARPNGESAKDEQGNRHRERRLVRVLVDVLVLRRPPEGHHVQAHHVEGRQHGGGEPDPEEDLIVVPGTGEDAVLREEAGCHIGQAGDGAHARQEGGMGDRHLLPEAAHLAHVLLVVTAVNHAARAKEHERLEEGVRREMEEGGVPGPDAKPEEHVAQLADRGVGQHALDVVLAERDEACHERRDRPHRRDHHQDVRREHRHRAPDEVHACRDHGGCVDQCADRRRAFHGIRKPDMEAELRALANRTEEEAESRGGEPGAGEGAVRDARKDRVEGERLDDAADDADGEQDAEVTDARGDEGLARRVGRVPLLAPEADQLVGAEADELPAHEEMQQVVREDEDQHRDAEHLQPREEEPVLRVALHVAHAEHVHEEGDEADHHEHDGRQAVHCDTHAPVDARRRLQPGPGTQRHRVAGVLPEHVQRDDDRGGQRDANRPHRQPVPLARQPPPEEELQHEAHERSPEDRDAELEEGHVAHV